VLSEVVICGLSGLKSGEMWTRCSPLLSRVDPVVSAVVKCGRIALRSSEAWTQFSQKVREVD
jgi:hypothetical protein